MNDLIPALHDFIKVFTVKRVITLLIVAFALLMVCSPQQEPATEDGGACDKACPLHQPVINVPPVVITSVSRENWSFALMDEGWTSEEPSNPDIKVIFYNKAEHRMVLLIKERTADMTLKEYGIESFKGFSEHGRIIGVTQTLLSNQKAFLFEGRVSDDEVFWSWNAIKDHFGYSLCCFYSIDVDAGPKQRDECQAIADSLQIN